MTDERSTLRRTGAEIVLRVARKTALLVGAGAAAAFAFHAVLQPSAPWWSLPAGVLFGGVLGLLNFRWLAVAVERVYLKQGATPAGANMAGVIINVLKLSVIFIVLFVVIKERLLDVFALLAGLSLCFLAIIWEGTTMMGTLNKGSDEKGTD